MRARPFFDAHSAPQDIAFSLVILHVSSFQRVEFQSVVIRYIIGRHRRGGRGRLLQSFGPSGDGQAAQPTIHFGLQGLHGGQGEHFVGPRGDIMRVFGHRFDTTRDNVGSYEGGGGLQIRKS